MRRSTRTWLVGAVALSLLVSACGSDEKETEGVGASESMPESITVGSANFAENVILMEMYAQALEAKGAKVTRQPNIGNREAYYAIVKKGDVDVMPDYTNSLLSFVTKGKPDAANTDQQVARLNEVLKADKLGVLNPSPAQDKDVLVCNAETAAALSLKTLEDVAAKSGEIVLGGPPEFATREPWGLIGLEKTYGATFKEFKPLDTAGPITVEALKSNDVQCANLFSTQSAVSANGFVVMEDTKGIVPAENIIPLVSDKVGLSTAAAGALNAVSAALDTTTLAGLVAKVEIDKADPAVVAKEFLTSKGLA
jgi:osmoprotectant transport system substrate-binding protein